MYLYLMIDALTYISKVDRYIFFLMERDFYNKNIINRLRQI